MIRELIDTIAKTSGCLVQPPAGLPSAEGYVLPDDLVSFYSQCGGISFFIGRENGITIVSPDEFTKANPVIAGVSDTGDLSDDWFIVAREGGQYVSIDLNPDRLGKCYDSFWDRHAVAGSSTVIAESFTEFLQKIATHSGKEWFWTSPGFKSLGDAYD